MNDLADLDFSTELPGVQRIVTCTIEGLLEIGDLQCLLERPAMPAGGQVGDLKKIREKHHSVARLVASGMQQSLVASLSGYTEAWLSTLLNNPAMQDLVAHYRASHSNAAEVIAERLREAGLGALEKLVEQMEGEGLDPQELLGLAKLGLDRSGHGPQSKVHQVTEHHLLDHAELQRLNRAARVESAGDIIQQVKQPSLPAPSAADAEGPDL